MHAVALSLCVCVVNLFSHFWPFCSVFGSHKMVYYNAAAMAVVEFCGRLASLTAPYRRTTPLPAPP